MHYDARALSLVSLVFGKVFFGGSPSLHDLFLHFFTAIVLLSDMNPEDLLSIELARPTSLW